MTGKRWTASNEISGAEICPCGSRKRYSACCKRRNFRWVRDKRGAHAKAFDLPPEVINGLKDVREKFLAIFGRNPRKTDPVFLLRYYMSDADMHRETLRAMQTAGLDPSLIYAFQKTDRIVSNPKLLTPEEQKEYEAAIDEFYLKQENSGLPISELLDPETPEKFMHQRQKQIQIIIGYLIDRHFNRINQTRRPSALKEVEFVVGFATLNFVRCLRSVLTLLDHDISYDAFALLRSLYENYITIKYLYANPEEVRVFQAQLGIAANTHRFGVNKRGAVRPDVIVERLTGKEIIVPSRYKMAASLGGDEAELYERLYRPLSAFVHSDINNFRHFISDNGFDYLNQDFTLEVLFSSLFLCMLLSSTLRKSSLCREYLKKDLLTATGKALFAILLTDEFLLAHDAGALEPIFERYISVIAEDDPVLTRIYSSVRGAAGRHSSVGAGVDD